MKIRWSSVSMPGAAWPAFETTRSKRARPSDDAQATPRIAIATATRAESTTPKRFNAGPSWAGTGVTLPNVLRASVATRRSEYRGPVDLRERLIVTPGSPADLAERGARATPGARSRKKAEKDLERLEARLDRLQVRLMAEARRSLLVVLQGMDTSGKDGTIKHAFA